MKDKTLAGILALFFGWMGVHRFYLGQVGLGIVYLFLIPVAWLLGIIDALAFFSMDQEEFDRKYNKEYYRRREEERSWQRDKDRRRSRDYQREERRQTRENTRSASPAKKPLETPTGIAGFKSSQILTTMARSSDLKNHYLGARRCCQPFNVACLIPL